MLNLIQNAAPITAFDSLNRKGSWIRTAMIGTSLGPSGQQSSGIAYNENNTTASIGIGQTVAYALSAEGFIITGSQCTGGSRNVTADGGTAPGLDDQITNLLAGTTPCEAVAVIAWTNNLGSSYNQSGATATASMATYEAQMARLRAVGKTIIHIIPPFRQATSGASNATRLQEYNNCVNIRALMLSAYSSSRDVVIDLFEQTARRAGGAFDVTNSPMVLQDGFSTDGVHLIGGGAYQAIRRGVAKAVAVNPIIWSLRNASSGVVLPCSPGLNFVQGQFDGLGATFPTAGATDWDTQGTAPTFAAIAPDSDGINGFTMTMDTTGGAATSYVRFTQPDGNMAVGTWYLFSAVHEMVSSTNYACAPAIRLQFQSNGVRTELLSQPFAPTNGYVRTAVAFKYPTAGFNAGTNTPHIQIGCVTSGVGLTVMRIKEINLHAMAW